MGQIHICATYTKGFQYLAGSEVTPKDHEKVYMVGSAHPNESLYPLDLEERKLLLLLAHATKIAKWI